MFLEVLCLMSKILGGSIKLANFGWVGGIFFGVWKIFPKKNRKGPNF